MAVDGESKITELLKGSSFITLRKKERKGKTSQTLSNNAWARLWAPGTLLSTPHPAPVGSPLYHS